MLVMERLDRFMANEQWLDSCPHATVLRLSETGSNHTPLILETNPTNEQSKRRFQFQEKWCAVEDVRKIVQEAWRIEIEGSPMYKLAQKLKYCRHQIVAWQRSSKSNFKKVMVEIEGQLDELRAAGITGKKEILEFENRLEMAYLQEERYWKEKSEVKWLKEGDKNTHFFHQKVKTRSQRNKICRLIGRNGEMTTTNSAIVSVAEDYYRDIFASSFQADPEPFLTEFEPKVTATMNQRLQRLVSMEEVKRAAFSIHPQSAPGEDGMTAKFYQFF
ncbi:uncharacterized protein [Arachis hypogaea]|uniref:uncharacterized protein n=1 Tax=Arachis hypogaea TaxID=3818 RepID=UPI003B218534